MLQGWADFKRLTVLRLELQGVSSANNSIIGRPHLTRTQEWCSQSVFKSQSFRTQNTVFLTRNVRDGYFPRAAHKSLLFCNVSERVCLHVLRKEWSSMGQDSPPTLPRTVLVICCGDNHWASVRKKRNMFLSEGSLSLKLSLVQPFVVNLDASSCITFFFFF